VTEIPATLQQPLLFLDTNAVHHARLYLGFARQHDLPPVGGSTGDPAAELKKAFGQRGQTLRSFDTGRKIVTYLQDRHDSGARIEYSPVTRLELVCGLLRGRAVLDAANEGIPHRMWNRIDEHEVFHRLSVKDYTEIQTDAEGLEELFQVGGIRLVETDPRRMSEVWRLAQLLLGVVFLDVGDSAVYASSLLAEADELLTTNGYLHWIANAIENPGGIQEPEEQTYFHQARSKLVQLVSQAIGIEVSEVHLPKAAKRW
jgi:hypothetical protein